MSNVSGIDKAIDAFVKEDSEEVFVTGWVIVASVSSAGHTSSESDGYLVQASEGLPHHTQLGLLNVAVEEKRSVSFFATMNHMLNGFDDEEDE